MEPKGHHKRGYLPHRDYGDALQAITFREADSLPEHVISAWKQELQQLLDSPDEPTQAKARQELLGRIARYEDAGHGRCHLRSPDIARIVQDILIEGHGIQYHLIAWCIMPNHVHVLIRQEPDSSLGKIVRSWKGRSARLINLALGRHGSFWARDYFDRAIRDEDHYWRAIAYIRRNPVKAGLVNDPADWPFSSKGQNWQA
jgi:REP element-mobilizing transposase RayT